MPKFIEDIYNAFLQVTQDAGGMWAGTSITTRLVLALVLAGLGVYVGARSEHSGLSALFFFAAFGFFAYVMAVGISLVR